MARKKREVGEINAGSMADIAFLLLIFFLVTTTMDVDTGIIRRLPPPIPPDQELPPPVKERNVFVVKVNANDQLLVEGQIGDISVLREQAKEFIRGYPNDPEKINFPEFKVEDLPAPFGSNYKISKQVISLQNDRGTSYDMYITVQNELAAAYNELRDELAQIKYGVPYKELLKGKKNIPKKKLIRKILPQRISEAEPVAIGQ